MSEFDIIPLMERDRHQAMEANLTLYGDPETNSAFHEGAMEEALQRFRAATAIKTFSPLGKDNWFLDVGCGQGKAVQALRKAGFSKVAGLDLGTERLTNVKARDPDSHYVAGLVQELPFVSNKFSGISAFEVYEHVPPEDGSLMLGEIYRILKPGGLFVLSTLNRKSLARRIFPDASTVEAHFNEVAYDQLQENIRKAGFKIEEVKGIGLVPLMWRAQRFLPFPSLQDWNIQAGARLPSISSATLVIAQKPLRDGP